MTVGCTEGTIRTTTNEGIQIALDALAYQGGGTVHVQAGTYCFKGPLRLRSQVKLVGAGAGNTIFKRGAAHTVVLQQDAGTGQKELYPTCIKNFTVGTGFVLRSTSVTNYTMPYTVSRSSKKMLHMDTYNPLDVLCAEEGSILNYFPLIHGAAVTDATVAHITLDGSALYDEAWRYRVWGANVYLRQCNNVVIKNIRSVNAHGDGVRCGQSLNIRIQQCEMAYNTHYGVHPGSHSAKALIEQCHVHHNGSDGIYLCWGIRHGKVLECIIHHNGIHYHRNGICTGHKNTDTLFAGNHIYENAKHGIHVRKKTEENGAHRTEIRDNCIENNGWMKKQIPEVVLHLPAVELTGKGIYISGITQGVIIADNVIRETRVGAERLQIDGVYIASGVTDLLMEGNTFTGHPGKNVIDAAKDISNTLQK